MASDIENVLQAMLDGEPYDKEPTSRVEGILKATLDDTEYTKPPLSRVEKLLLDIKESGGGGGSGGIKIDKIIDYATYSEPGYFTEIALPSNYTDYDLLYMYVVVSDMDQEAFDVDMPLIRSPYDGIVKVSDISATDVAFYPPIYNSDFSHISVGSSAVINSSRILGTNYGMSWQKLYLVCWGIKLQGGS